MKEIELHVTGMHCSGCENRVKNSVGDLKEVKEVHANHENGIVKVILKKECDENLKKEITNIIERLDFKVE